jgi:hypothetical protein
MRRILLCIVLLLISYTNLFAYLSQGNWRWRNNDGTEKTATWKAGQDTGITISDNKAIRLRIDIYNAQASTKYYGDGLEYSTSLSNGPWLPVSSSVTAHGAAFIYDGNNSFISNSDTTSAQLTETGNYKFAHGSIITESYDFNDSLLVSQRKEYEWCIKPTSYITPNTKYYFRASTGAGQTSNLPTLTTNGNFTGPPDILSNGGFEQGLTGWADTDKNGGNTFTIEDTAVYSGAQALRVTVTNPGTPGSVETVHSNITTADTSRVYLLRFWAKADVNAAGITLSLQGANTNYQVAFKMYTQWQRYQFAFKTADTSLAVKFLYQTRANYVLDEVTVVDDTDPVTDVDMTYMWQNNRAGYGWLTADGQESVPLPGGGAAWFFSDTWLGYNNPLNNFTNTDQLVNNDLVAQTGKPPYGTLNTYFTGTSASPLALMLPITPAGVQYWYWPRDPIIENDTIKIILPEVERATTNAAPTFTNITSVASITLPDFKVVNIENIPYLGTDQYTVLLHEDTGAYNYAYGSRTVGSQTYATIARYPRDHLSAAVPWQFLSDTSWVSDYTKATSISGNTFGAIVKLGPGNYAAVYEPDVSQQIYVMYAPTPWGPWINSTLVYQIPELNNGITYFAYLHKETANNGVYTLSYSTNTGIPQMLNDKGTYQPHFVKANILGLSPFTVQKPTDTLLSFTAKNVSQKVQLNWATALTSDDHFDVQRSPDGVNWSVIATVEGSDSTALGNYADLDDNPIQGLNYYRIALYDIDNKLTYSAVKTVDLTQTATLLSFTAKRDNEKVQLNWATSAELNNPGFIVQRSIDTTDASGWSTIAAVAGNGTTATASNYQAFDDKPINGINYYRLQYYSNNAVTYSIIRAVNMSALVFNVYPNPATAAAIKFELSGYQQNSFSATLVDISGKVFDKENFSVSNGGGSYTLQVKPPAGVYIIKVYGNELNKSSKVIVQ